MILKLHPNDNVLIALQDIPAWKTVQWEQEVYQVQEWVPAKHKFAARDFTIGETIHMYGIVVGKATRPIPAGAVISTENVVHASDPYSTHRRALYQWKPLPVEKWQQRQFMGYPRSDGRVGTANHWLFIPLVFCENRNLEVIREVLNRELGYSKSSGYSTLVQQLVLQHQAGKEQGVTAPPPRLLADAERVFPHLDGIKFLLHAGGCGGTRDDARALCQLLAGYVCHPNVAGATVVSLGCQHAQSDWLKEAIREIDPAFDKPLLLYEQQVDADTEAVFLKRIIQETFEQLQQANEARRRPAPLSKLCIGLECGGSDGFSGITANPAMGWASDLLVSLGGSVILSEFPELCGVEQELIDRCSSQALAEKFIRIQRAYAHTAEAVGSGFDRNPSPGNIKDGLITDAIKSAGAARKGGSSPVTDVLDYTEQVRKPGLNLLCTPGNDVESTTALAASGANLILFSTGLGTPTGNPVTPVIKIASNSKLANRLSYMIDLDAGRMLTESLGLTEMGEAILEHCIRVASGELPTKAQLLNQDDFIPWKRGVSL